MAKVTTTTQPSPTCPLCAAGLRRYHETIYTPSEDLTERNYIHHVAPGRFEFCADQTEHAKVIR